MAKKHNCFMMNYYTQFRYPKHESLSEWPVEVDTLIYFSKKRKRYGIVVQDGGGSFVLIEYCPWCGKKL